MRAILLSLLIVTGCQHKVESHPVLKVNNSQYQYSKSQIQLMRASVLIAEESIKSNNLDLSITDIEPRTVSRKDFRMAGTAISNQSIASLVEEFENHPDIDKAYISSIDQFGVKKEERRAFTMNFTYQPK